MGGRAADGKAFSPIIVAGYRLMFRLLVWRLSAVCVALGLLPVVALSADAPPRRSKGKFVPTNQYTRRTVEGWTVHVNKKLLAEQADLGTRALRLLEVKVYDIRQVVPARPCGELQKVPI